eukprot:scaffold751_cov395-Prasinococcus_capsulatus_cf.AAC.9
MPHCGGRCVRGRAHRRTPRAPAAGRRVHRGPGLVSRERRSCAAECRCIYMCAEARVLSY